MRSTYYSFKNEWIGKRVDVDNSFGYQCIDLAKKYMDEVLLIKVGKTGSAKEMRDNKYHCFDSSRSKITGTKDLMQGDIIFSTNGTNGHVAIVDRIVNGKIQVLEQNGSGKDSGSGIGENAIRLHSYSTSFFVGVWRCQKIFDNLQIERGYCDEKIKDTIDYKNSIRYQS